MNRLPYSEMPYIAEELQPQLEQLQKQEKEGMKRLDQQKQLIVQKRLEIWKPILEQMPEFQALSEQGKQKALETLKYKPNEFLQVVKKTKYYQELSDTGKKNLMNSLFMPTEWKKLKSESKTFAEQKSLKYEGDTVSKDVYIDPKGWAGVGIASGLTAIPAVIAGDIVGETTKYLTNKLTGNEVYQGEEGIFKDYLIPLTFDVISGVLGGRIADRLFKSKAVNKIVKAVAEKQPEKVKEIIKTEVPEVADNQLDDLTKKMSDVMQTVTQKEEPKTLEKIDEALNKQLEEIPIVKKPQEMQKEAAEVGADVIDEANQNYKIDTQGNNLRFTKEELEEIKKEIKDFQYQLKKFEKGDLSPNDLLIVSKPKNLLKTIGFPDVPITINQKTLRKKINKHNLTLEDIKELPRLINDPVMVYKLSKEKNTVIATARVKNGGILLTAIKVNADKSQLGRNAKVNDIRSVYFKDVNKFLKHLEILQTEGDLIFLDKGKIGNLLKEIANLSPASGGTIPPSGLIDNLEQKAKTVKFYAGIPTSELFKQISKLDNLIYKKFTSKIEDTKFDQFVRKYLLADKYGFGSLSRAKEDKIIDDYYKLKAHLARGDLSAEKKERILNKYLNRLDEGARIIREKFMIQYLENPAVREKARQELPEVAKELDQIRKEIDRLGKLKMERGLITPSQFEKWKDKYLTRLYVMEDEVEGIDLLRGLKQYEEKKGRKIDSIVDFIEHLKKEDPVKAQEWESKTILDPIKAVKATLAKSYANLAIDDFYRKMLDDPEIIPQRYLVELPVQINNLPKKMSPYYAESKVLPYLRDILKKDRDNKEIREAIKSLRKQIKEKKAVIEAEKQLLEKAGYKILGDKTKARYSVVSGLPIHKDIANMIEGMTRIIENPMDTASKLDKWATSAIAYFKWAKVPANIFSYPRNIMSNWIQFAMSGADPVSFPEYFVKALYAVAKKDKYYKLAEKWGLFHSNLSSEEITKIFKELRGSIKEDSKKAKAFKFMLKAIEKIGDAYGMIDDLAKLARFRYAIEVENKPVKEALRIAQDTHFDYGLTYNVIRAMRDPNVDRGVFLKLFGTLFPTYTHKALSFLYDTMIKRPITLTALVGGFIALKQYIEQKNEEKVGKEKYEQIKKLQPEFLDSPFVLPIVDKDGKWVTYIDASYVIPFGNLVNFVHDMLQGQPGEAIRELGALSNPIYSAKALHENRDPLTGRPIYYPHNKIQKAKDIAKYSFNQFLAPGTISNLQRYWESKHPVVPRVLTGMLFYEYPKEQLQEFKLMQIRRIQMDTQRKILKLKRDLQYYARKYRDGKISKSEYETKKRKVIEDIKKYQQMGNNAVKSIIETLQ